MTKQENKQEKSPIKERILQYLDSKGISKYSFYKDSGISRNILDQNTGISEDNISRFLAYAPEVSVKWLLTGNGSIYEEEVESIPINANCEDLQIKPEERTIIVDSFDLEAIPIVDISAAAGSGAYNPDYFNNEDVIRLPAHMLHRGLHHCIRIKGQSMSPTFMDGGYIVIRLLDRCEWKDIKEKHVYVVTDMDGKTYVKRLKNRLLEHGFIVCMSDNPDKSMFPNFNLDQEEIHNVWEVEWYMTAKMPNIHDTYYNQVQTMQDDLDELKDTVKRYLKSVR